MNSAKRILMASAWAIGAALAWHDKRSASEAISNRCKFWPSEWSGVVTPGMLKDVLSAYVEANKEGKDQFAGYLAETFLRPMGMMEIAAQATAVSFLSESGSYWSSFKRSDWGSA